MRRVLRDTWIRALLNGCGVARLDGSLGRAVMQNSDLAAVEAGLPSYLLMVDGLIVNWPERSGLLMTGADLYGAYAGVFVDDEARAARLNEKALAYALRGACAHDGDYCDLRHIEVPAFEALLDEAGQDDGPVLFSLGSAWAGYIQQNTSDWNAVAELGRVEAIMARIVALDEGYQYGQAHMDLGVLNSIRPAPLGGKPEEAKAPLDAAAVRYDGNSLLGQQRGAQKHDLLGVARERTITS